MSSIGRPEGKSSSWSIASSDFTFGLIDGLRKPASSDDCTLAIGDGQHPPLPLAGPDCIDLLEELLKILSSSVLDSEVLGLSPSMLTTNIEAPFWTVVSRLLLFSGLPNMDETSRPWRRPCLSCGVARLRG